MKIKDLLEYVDELQENVFSPKVKIRWINQLEAEVQTEILLMAADGVVQHTVDDMETDLIAPPPHDQIYQEYLFWQIALAQGEAERANNASELFNRVLQEYKRFVAMTINPGNGNAELLRYYINAYQIAVKNGFTGTETQWLHSLIGKAGEPGAGLNIVDQVASESQLPEGTSLEAGTGYLVGEGTTALLYIWNGREWFYKTQLSGKGEKGDKGDTGPRGAQGLTGLTGEKGEKGDKGDTGPRGAQGLTGLTGEKGDKGDTGPQGPKGETGSGFRVLDYYASLSALQTAVRYPNAGDSYGVGTSEPYDIYIYGGTSGWVNNGPLQGAKGDTGPTGPKGDKGDTGATGAQGIQGEQGPKGDAGVSISKVEQTTTSTADGGTNIITVTLSNGQKATFNVKNGSRGSTGDPGKDGDDGADGRGVVNIRYAGEGYWNISYTDNTQESIPGPEIPEEKPDITGIFYEYWTSEGFGAWTIAYRDGKTVQIDGTDLATMFPMFDVGGVFRAKVSAKSGVDNTAQLRNTALVSADTNPTVNGQINWTYA
jgi:hypothetical protein